ncbi:MAG: OmpA family protein [Desulfobacula sp.]|jgi:flagellar motor protein MotB|nr:OmpA family protein [Desulfobacula sp.]
MGKQQGYTRTGLKKMLICLSVLICIGLFIRQAEANQAEPGIHLDSQKMNSQKTLIQTYHDQISFIQSEIQKIQQDKDWLALKIKRMEAFDRFVPQRFYSSIKFKKSKIKSLEKLKQTYETLLKSIIPPRSDKIAKTDKKNFNSGFEKNLRKKIIAIGLEDWVELVPNETPLCLENRLPILFPSGSVAIAKGYESFLKNLAALVKGYEVRIIIDGYADTDPIRTKRYSSNFELGASRAAAIVQSLVKYGVKPSVFKIGSTGEYRFDSHKASQWKNLQRHVNIAVLFISKV